MTPAYQFTNNKYQSEDYQASRPYVLYAPIKASEEETAQRITEDAIVADIIYTKALKGGQGLSESRWAPKNFAQFSVSQRAGVSKKSSSSLNASADEWSPNICPEKQVSPKSGSSLENSRWSPKNLGEKADPSSRTKSKVNFKSPSIVGVKVLTSSSQYPPSQPAPSSWGQTSISSDTLAMHQAGNCKSAWGSNGAQPTKVTSTPPLSSMSNKLAEAREPQTSMRDSVQPLQAIPPHMRNISTSIPKQESRTRTPEQIVRHHLRMPKANELEHATLSEQPRSGKVTATVLPSHSNKLITNTNSSNVATEISGTSTVQQLYQRSYGGQPMAAAAAANASNVTRRTGSSTRPPGWIPPHLSHLPPEQVQRIQNETAASMAYRVSSQTSSLIAESTLETPEQTSFPVPYSIAESTKNIPERVAAQAPTVENEPVTKVNTPLGPPIQPPGWIPPHLANPYSAEQLIAHDSTIVAEPTIQSPVPSTIADSATKTFEQVAAQSTATIVKDASNVAKPAGPPCRPPRWIPPHLSHLTLEQVEQIQSETAASMAYQVLRKASNHTAISASKTSEQVESAAPVDVAESVEQIPSQASISFTVSTTKEAKPGPFNPSLHTPGWGFTNESTGIAVSVAKETQEAPAARESPDHHQELIKVDEHMVGNVQPQSQVVPAIQLSGPTGRVLQPLHTENMKIPKSSEKNVYEADRIANDKVRMDKKAAAAAVAPKPDYHSWETLPCEGSPQVRPLEQQRRAGEMTHHNKIKDNKRYSLEELGRDHDIIMQAISSPHIKPHDGTDGPQVSSWGQAVAKKLHNQENSQGNSCNSQNPRDTSDAPETLHLPISSTIQQQLDHAADPLTKEALQQTYGAAPTECGTRSVVSNTSCEEKKLLKHQPDPRGHIYDVHEEIEVRWDGTWGPDFRDWHDRPDFDDSKVNEYIKQWANSLRDIPPVCLDIKDPAFTAGKYVWYNRFIDHPDVGDYPKCRPNPSTDSAVRQFGDTTETRVAEHVFRRAKRSKILRMGRNVAVQTFSPIDVAATTPPNNNAKSPKKECLYIRPAFKKDLPQITKIYNHYVLNSIIPEDQAEMTVGELEQVYLDCQRHDLPFIVAISSYPPTKKEMKEIEHVVGFGFIEDWSVGIMGASNGRSRHTGKVNFYVHSSQLRKGIGYNILDRLLEVMIKGYTSQARCPFVAPAKAPYAPGGGGKKAYHQIMIEMPYRVSEKVKQGRFEDWLRNHFSFNRVANFEGIARSKGCYGRDAEFLNVAILQRCGDHYLSFVQYP